MVLKMMFFSYRNISSFKLLDFVAKENGNIKTEVA